MDIKNTVSNNNGAKEIANNKNNSKTNAFGIKMNAPLKSDVVSFSGKAQDSTPREKMEVYAVKFLDEIGLKEDQPLQITADSKYVPFLRVLSEEAYKKGSGRIAMKIVEPEIEALKKKYEITEEFDYKKEAKKELENDGAIFVNFDDKNSPYKAAGLNKKESAELVKSLYPNIPKKVQDIFKLDPEELFKSALDMHEGQPAILRGEREHLPQIIKLADYLYSKNKTKLIDVRLTEAKEYNPDIAFYKNAKDDLIGKFQQSTVNAQKEFYEKDTALLALNGADPELMSEVDSKRMVANTKPVMEAVKEYRNKITSNTPWLVYYAPTTKSVGRAYPEYGDDKIAALAHALKDAKEINRVGKLKEHVANIELRANKMNELLDKGYRSIRFVSVDPESKKPDGKTDLIVGLAKESIFGGARMNMEKYGHKPLVNVPTEEVFTSPTNNTAEGKISATMPLVLNGKVVEGIEMTFKKGKAVSVNATKNVEMLKEHIKNNKNADRLGEVALVAGSPIFKKDRLFYSTLLDENAACHLAIGNAYADVVKGANEFEDYAEQQKYLKDLHINSSTAHNDFMIGGPNVYVYAENPKTGEQVQVIKDDKFLL